MDKKDLIFNKNTIQALKTNYSPIEKIKIIDNSTTNTFNTFNTFWKCVERNGDLKSMINSAEITNSEQKLDIEEETINYNDKNNQNDSAIFIEDQIASPDTVLKVLKVLKVLVDTLLSRIFISSIGE